MGHPADGTLGIAEEAYSGSQPPPAAIGTYAPLLGTGDRPSGVTEEVLDEYMRYRAELTALAADAAARRKIARAWNACVEGIKQWPRSRLIEPPVKALAETAWESFAKSLREEIERYLAGFKKIRRGVSGKRIRPCKESTINTRRRELQAFARMAVRLGQPIEGLASLEALLDPALVEEVLNAYWEENGE